MIFYKWCYFYVDPNTVRGEGGGGEIEREEGGGGGGGGGD